MFIKMFPRILGSIEHQTKYGSSFDKMFLLFILTFFTFHHNPIALNRDRRTLLG